MIIYGTKAKVLLTEPLTEPCPNCQANGLYMNVVQRWAHIFWVPTFPTGKTGVSQCMQCKQALKDKQMPPALKLEYDNLKLRTKTPLWTFTGIVVIAAIFGIAAIIGKQKAERVTKMIPALQKNDVLKIKIDDKTYTLAKVTEVKGDSVFFINSAYQTNMESGLDGLKSKAYDTELRVITVAELKDMDKKDQLVDIERN